MGWKRERTAPTRWFGGLVAVAGSGLLLLAPAWWALRRRRPTVVEGVASLDDAVAACARSDLSGWELVLFAQRMVYHKFVYYSCRNLWDTPAQAFRYGMGYCTQYNLALKQILTRLGIETQAVYSMRISVHDNPDWSMGHTWLRVTIQGESRTVCAGRPDNRPGRVHFDPVAPVRQGNEAQFFLLHLGMIVFCGYLEWRSLLTRQPLPDWMFQDRT